MGRVGESKAYDLKSIYYDAFNRNIKQKDEVDKLDAMMPHTKIDFTKFNFMKADDVFEKHNAPNVNFVHQNIDVLQISN